MSAAKRTFALPLLVLALLMQAWAPAAAGVAAARMLDPLANLPICSTSLEGGQKDPAAPSPHRDQDCAACTVCSAPVAALAREPSVSPRGPAVAAVSLQSVEIVGPHGLPRRTAQARAPPLQA
jgi:hypothetical protein